jgi:CTP-dependent riboflavin kinase
VAIDGNQDSPALLLAGTFRISHPTGPRVTCGGFSKLINDNAEVFLEYFGVSLFPGSLNITLPNPRQILDEFDRCAPNPAIVVPRQRLTGMPDYIGEGHAWRCRLRSSKIPPDFSPCWIFRRVGSRIPYGIEVVSPCALVDRFKLRNGDSVEVAAYEG